MADQSISSSHSSSRSWLDLQQDFERARESLALNTDIPTKAWQPLSKALSKHTSIAGLPEPLKWAVPNKLPWTLCTCIALIVDKYKIHQNSRRKDLCQLCELTAQLCVQCAQQQDTHARISLAKQAKESGVLRALQRSLTGLSSGLVETAAAADRPRKGREAFDTLGSDLKLVHAQLQLFDALNSSWPGEAGVQSSNAGAAAALAAGTAAGQLLHLSSVAVDQAMMPADHAEQCIRCAASIMGTCAQQLNSRAMRLAQLSFETQQPEAASAQLQSALLLWGLQLENITATPGMTCRSCCAANSHNSSLGSAAASPTAPNSCNSSRTISNAVALSAADSAAAAAAAAATSSASCIRCNSRSLLLSVFRSTGSTCLPDNLWHAAIQAAAASLSSPHKHLELLQVLLHHLRDRCEADMRKGRLTSLHDKVLCRPLAPLTVTLLDTASSWYDSGQQQQAAAAIGAASAAAAAWWWCSALRRFGTSLSSRKTSSAEPGIAYGVYETDSVTEVFKLVGQLLKQVLLFSAEQAGNESGSGHSSSSSSSSSDDGVQGTVEALFLSLYRTLEAASQLHVAQQSGVTSDWSRALLSAVPAIEGGIRALVTAAAAAGGTAVTGAVGVAADDRTLPAIISHVRDALADHHTEHTAENATRGSESCLVPAAAACDNSQLHNPLFALLASSVKLAMLQPTLRLSASAAKAALGMLDWLCKDTQLVSAAAAAAALPWLGVTARSIVASAAGLSTEVSNLKQPAVAAAAAAASTAKAVAKFDALDWNALIRSLSDSLHQLFGKLRPFTTEQQLDSLKAATTATTTAVAATIFAHPELAQLLQQWELQLLPTVKQAELLTTYAFNLSLDMSSSSSCEDVLSELSALPAAAAALEVANEAAAVTGPDKYQLDKDRLLLIFNSPLLQQLPQQLEAAGHQLCTLLPLPLCCNNPACVNLSRQSELQLVGGKACVCAGCEVARYCGRECQAAHWQAHKRVCKMIKKAKAAAAAAAECSSSSCHAGPT